MKKNCPSRAPRSTVPTSPRPVGKATVKGWYFVPVVAALVALSGCEGGFPTSDLYSNLAKAKAETACYVRPDSNDTNLGGTGLLPLLPVSSFVFKKSGHLTRSVGSGAHGRSAMAVQPRKTHGATRSCVASVSRVVPLGGNE